MLQAQGKVVGVTTACVLWVSTGDPRNYHSAAAYRKAIDIKPDHAEAALRKPLAKGLRPGDHLGAKPHNQQDGRRFGGADLVVGEVDTIRGCNRHRCFSVQPRTIRTVHQMSCRKLTHRVPCQERR